MSRYRIISINPDHDVYVGWDPGNQTFFLQVYHWAQHEDDGPFIWKGVFLGQYSRIVSFVDDASVYAHFSHYAIQTLQNDKVTNSSKNRTQYDYLGNDETESPFKNLSEQYQRKFLKAFLNMGCTVYKKGEPYEGAYDYYYHSLTDGNWIARIVFGKNELTKDQLIKIVNIISSNDLSKGFVFSFQPFSSETHMIAKNYRITLFDYNHLKSFAYYWWWISEKANELSKLLNHPFYILDYGIGPKIDNKAVKSEVYEIGNELNSFDGFRAMQGAFYIFASKVNDPQLPRELEVIWHGVGEWRC